MTTSRRYPIGSPHFPTPDRSNFTPNFSRTADNDVLDIGWAEGLLSDGRPYRLECWAQDQVTSVSIFVARAGLEDLEGTGLQAFLEREQLVQFVSPRRFASAQPFTDPSGNDLLSISVVVGDDEERYVAGGPALQRYSRS